MEEMGSVFTLGRNWLRRTEVRGLAWMMRKPQRCEWDSLVRPERVPVLHGTFVVLRKHRAHVHWAENISI